MNLIPSILLVQQEENVAAPPKGQSIIPPMVFNDLSWQFKIKEDFSLRLVLHNKEGQMLGLLSISPQTLFSNKSAADNDEFVVSYKR